MRIIPAIDIINGQCVRLTKGDYGTKKIYNEDPLEVAKMFEASGIEYLHLVDLDGAKAHHIVNHNVLETIATHTRLKIDFGGGLKSSDDLKIAFDCGAQQVTGGSIAVKDPHQFLEWLDTYGADKIILGADCMNGGIAIQGWQEQSELEVHEFVQNFVAKGVLNVICTDISKDGMLQGPSFELYNSLLSTIQPLNLIASGGISGAHELPELKTLGCEGVIIGKALYENKITLKELEQFQIKQPN
jgi:phosphoribosylformimino-5-aminoimidazole carboxamide ribotide isomerase